MERINQVISSILVHSDEEHFENVKQKIITVPQAEIIQTEENKFAIVLETESTEYAAGLCEDFRSLDGVTAVEIISHFFENENSK